MSITSKHIRNAVSLLLQEQLVAFPTETVYGLGGNALSDTAVASIYAMKERPSFNPLIVHVRSLEDANHYAIFSERALLLARSFWPGPLTLVLPRRQHCTLSLLVSAGLDSVAIRVPAHPLAQALLHEAKIPVAAPSANRSGRVSPTEAAHVYAEFDDRVTVLDGGPCHLGIESTVLDATGEHIRLLRPGSVTPPMIEKLLGRKMMLADASEKPISPGMLASHYAPTLPVRLNATSVAPDEALLAFGPSPLPGALLIQNLSRNANLQEAAANLFRMLRMLDLHGHAAGAKAIAVMPIPDHGEANALGLAINDRLTRAAAPR